MTLRSRKPSRALPLRKISLRAPVQLVDDTEKLMYDSVETQNGSENDLARSHPKLSSTSQPVPHHDYTVHETTNVPAPIPDTGLPPPSVDTTEMTPSQTSATKVSSARHAATKSTFVPLPSLKTLNLTEMEDEAARSSISLATHPTPTRPQSATVTTVDSNAHDRTRQSNTPHLSTAVIIALAVCVGLILFAMALLMKFVKRPRRRRTPTPSLPILHDGTFPGDKVESEGSPIFGGKERSSPTPQAHSAKGNTGIWTWTQYNSGIPRPAPTMIATHSSSQNQQLAVNPTTQEGSLAVIDDATHAQGQTPGPYLLNHSDAILKNQASAPLQPVQNAITRAVSRLSTVSMSLYPNSPGGYSQVGADVGLAIDGVTQGEPASLTPAKNRGKMMAPRNRTSMMAPSSLTKDATELRRSQSYAYGGMEPISSPAAPLNKGQFNSGRARIKSTYYTPGSYPRASAANYGKHNEQDGILRGEDRVERADSRPRRELTSALGLTSPVLPSPQPTLYPDDSMSVIGEAKKVTLTGRSQKKPVPKASSHYESPPSDTAVLGNLMMADIGASKSTASLVNIRPCEAARAREGHVVMAGKSNLKKKVEDKPPRVPSPPPIPSLAQMALQHADPEGYADYHSPTYSIYGLYDGDRKSRGLSYGY